MQSQGEMKNAAVVGLGTMGAGHCGASGAPA